MISRIYRLVDTKQIELKLREIPFTKDSVLIKPKHLSICAADQRYYLGQRDKETLNKKLPMALIHEATGSVIHDFSGRHPIGTDVVLIPLKSGSAHSGIKGNYRIDSLFASSGVDGFMRDVVSLPVSDVVPIVGDYSEIYVFSELVSVALNAIEGFEQTCRTSKDSFGVWGDGSTGFIMCLVLRNKYPNAKIYVIGKEPRKLLKFSFVTKTYYVDQVPSGLQIDHCFECVGTENSEAAISQMLEMISPQGVMNLLGVSEEAIAIETRKILDKGLAIVGHSRSDANDFREAVSQINENPIYRKYLKILISEHISVKTEADIYRAFERDILNDFKTVIHWSL